MRLGENILGHLLQEPRGRSKRLPWSRLLKGSPSAQPVCSPVEYLQKRGIFVFKYRSVSAEPDNAYKDEVFELFWYSIKQPSE